MIELTTLNCPNCGARLNLPPQARSVSCEYCGSQHSLRPERSPGAPGLYEIPARPFIALPKGITLKKFTNGLRLVRRWFSLKTIPLTFFCLLWDGFLVFWYAMAFSMGAPFIFKLFPVIHLAVGVVPTYSVLAGYLNYSVIELTASTFQVYHDPMPWPGELKLPIRQLEQLYCTRTEHHSRNVGDTVTYTLCAILQGGRRIDLLNNLDSPDVALYLEQQIESWLRIADQPVGDELPRYGYL